MTPQAKMHAPRKNKSKVGDDFGDDEKKHKKKTHKKKENLQKITIIIQPSTHLPTTLIRCTTACTSHVSKSTWVGFVLFVCCVLGLGGVDILGVFFSTCPSRKLQGVVGWWGSVRRRENWGKLQINKEKIYKRNCRGQGVMLNFVHILHHFSYLYAHFPQI